MSRPAEPTSSRFDALKGDDMGFGGASSEPYRPATGGARPAPKPQSKTFDATKSSAAAAKAAGAEDKVKGMVGDVAGTLIGKMEESEARVSITGFRCSHAPMRGVWWGGLPISRAVSLHRLDRTGQYLRAWRPLSPGHSP